jgi:hypothetical protein
MIVVVVYRFFVRYPFIFFLFCIGACCGGIAGHGRAAVGSWRAAIDRHHNCIAIVVVVVVDVFLNIALFCCC